jgi:hypothetical protein
MADKSIFGRLRKLFSGDVVIRNLGGDQLKVIDTNQIQQSGDIETNSLYSRYSRIFMPTVAFQSNYSIYRSQLYSDYEAMDTDAICSSTLDVVSDEATLKNDMGEVLQIKSSDEDIQKILYNLFYDVLNIEFNLTSWVRNMAKYGDFFLKLDIAEGYGVYNVIPYSAYVISREENFDRDNPNAVRFRYNPEGIVDGYEGSGYQSVNLVDNYNAIYFDNYEIAHFRLLSDVNYLPYGRSYLEPGRKVWKQLMLMEDAFMIHRIVRAPEKRVFYINVGNIPPNEIETFMQQTINKMKKTPYIDPQTGQYNLKYNIQNMLEDFYIPVKGNDTSTKIDTTKGLEYAGMEDIIYLRDKLFAALKIPKAYLGYDAQLSGKATLASEDIRFARTVERVQKIIISELYKIALIHLYVQGYKEDNLTNFEISLTTPSIIYEQEKLNVLTQKVDLAQKIFENNILPSDWVYDHIFNFSEDSLDEYRDLMVEDAKRKFRLTQITEEGNDPLETGKSYGTPHELSANYGKGRYADNSNPTPKPDGDKGRPVERATNIDTQDSPFGRDRLGVKGMKTGDEPVKKSIVKLSETKVELIKNKKILDSLKERKSLLDEKNIIEE